MNIILCGFMGCGKTTIGKYLSKMLGYSLTDTDKIIQKKFNMTVSEVFATLGEQKFRLSETDVLRELLDADNQVIATGGGLVINPNNIELINSHRNAVLVYIDVPLRALQERLKRDVRRPLLQREDRYEFIENLHNQRHPIYKSVSKLAVDGGAPILVVAKRIKKLLLTIDK